MVALAPPAFAIPRASPRLSLTGELPGVLSSDRHEELTVMAVDVCPAGLGLLVQPSLLPGETVTWRFSPAEGPAVTLAFTVVWGNPVGGFARIRGMEDVMRVGLKARDPSCDLVALCRGCDGLHVEE